MLSPVMLILIGLARVNCDNFILPAARQLNKVSKFASPVARQHHKVSKFLLVRLTPAAHQKKPPDSVRLRRANKASNESLFRLRRTYKLHRTRTRILLRLRARQHSLEYNCASPAVRQQGRAQNLRRLRRANNTSKSGSVHMRRQQRLSIKFWFGLPAARQHSIKIWFGSPVAR